MLHGETEGRLSQFFYGLFPKLMELLCDVDFWSKKVDAWSTQRFTHPKYCTFDTLLAPPRRSVGLEHYSFHYSGTDVTNEWGFLELKVKIKAAVVASQVGFDFDFDQTWGWFCALFDLLLFPSPFTPSTFFHGGILAGCLGHSNGTHPQQRARAKCSAASRFLKWMGFFFLSGWPTNLLLPPLSLCLSSSISSECLLPIFSSFQKVGFANREWSWYARRGLHSWVNYISFPLHIFLSIPYVSRFPLSQTTKEKCQLFCPFILHTVTKLLPGLISELPSTHIKRVISQPKLSHRPKIFFPPLGKYSHFPLEKKVGWFWEKVHRWVNFIYEKDWIMDDAFLHTFKLLLPYSHWSDGMDWFGCHFAMAVLCKQNEELGKRCWCWMMALSGFPASK